MVVFAACLIAGFNIGFAAGRPAAQATPRAEKPTPELAKLTTKPTPPVAATQPTAVKPAARPEPVTHKPEPAKTPELVAKPETMTKPDAMEKPAAMTKPEPAKTPAAKDDEPAPKKPEPKKPDPTPEAKKPEPKKPEPKKPATAAAPTFAKVSVILKSKCAECHEAKVKKGGLDVRSLASLKTGGGSGPAVVPGDLKSPLWETIDTNQMPPPNKEQLTDDEKKLIHDWIAGGAKP